MTQQQQEKVHVYIAMQYIDCPDGSRRSDEIADDPARIADAQISIMGFIRNVGLH